MSSYRFLTNKRSKITSVSPKNELQPKYFLSINSFLLVYNIREGKSRTLNRLTTRRSEQHSVGWQCHGVTLSPFKGCHQFGPCTGYPTIFFSNPLKWKTSKIISRWHLDKFIYFKCLANLNMAKSWPESTR